MYSMVPQKWSKSYHICLFKLYVSRCWHCAHFTGQHRVETGKHPAWLNWIGHVDYFVACDQDIARKGALDQDIARKGALDQDIVGKGALDQDNARKGHLTRALQGRGHLTRTFNLSLESIHLNQSISSYNTSAFLIFCVIFVIVPHYFHQSIDRRIWIFVQ